MNMKAISEKLTNAKTLLKLEVKDVHKIAERKPLTPEQKKAFMEEIRHSEEMIRMRAEVNGMINKAVQNLKK